MAKFIVTIKQTILTEVTVEAASKTDARKSVQDYGADLACADFPAQDAYKTALIQTVRAA